MRFLILVCAVWVTATTMACSISPDRSTTDTAGTKVDQLFAEQNRTDSPGCGVGVSREGAMVYEHGYGMANLELGVPITSDTVFGAASISKQFTAMSILLLVEQGKLSLDDELHMMIAEWIDHEHHITIRQLLNHTSGLREGFGLLGWAAPTDGSIDTNTAILSVLARQQDVNFTPGTEYQYNNSTYNLLGSIVKRVSGQSLRTFADANIFKPLGMTSTSFRDDPGMIIAHRASGYSKGQNGWHHGSEAVGVVGNAGLYSTVRDLLRWQQNLGDVRVGTPALIAAMLTPPKLPASHTSSYGFGVVIGQDRGLRTIAHAGGDSGIATYLVRYPDQDLGIAVLCNTDSVSAGFLAQQVAEIFLSDVLPPPPSSNASPAPHTSSSSWESVEKLAGVYYDTSGDSSWQISARAHALMARSFYYDDTDYDLSQLDANRFAIPGGSQLEFVMSFTGRQQTLRILDNDGKQAVETLQLADFTGSAAELQAFAGEYRNPEIPVTYTVAVRESQLLVQPPGRTEIAVHALTKDTFAGSGVGTVRFARDSRGGIAGFTLNRFNARRVQFDRLKR